MRNGVWQATTRSRAAVLTAAYTTRQQKAGAKIAPVAVAIARERDSKLDAVIDAELAKMQKQGSG